MVDTPSWAWLGTGNWPGFSTNWRGNPNSQNYLQNSGNGLTIDPNNYSDIIWRDGGNRPDGIIDDNDSGDGTNAGSDRVVINGSPKTVHEVAVYENSTLVINGETHQMDVIVWLFTDGTYMVRIEDADIPAYTHHSKVTEITLGTWDGAEYSGTFIAPRTDPFLCFTPGTLIETPDGPRLVEDLRPGDLVLTADHGAQPLRWIGQRTVAAQGAQAPVLIRKGALGNTRDLLLSPQHRMLLTGWQAELYAGSDEVLAAALHLVNGDTITRAPGGMVTYIHLLFDEHEIIWAEGIPTESFHPGAYAMNVLDDAARAELLALFPELDGETGYGPLARPCAQGWEARAMAS